MSKLTPKQQRFVDEYLIDLNAADAYRRAGYKGDENVCAVEGHKLLRNPKIAGYLSERMKAREERTEITQDMVLKRWWEIANVDVNDLVEYRRDNCRYCWGIDHQYQWSEAEYQLAVQQAAEKDKEAPDCAGGFGFIATREPNPECPECGGEGRGKIHVHDSRRLKGPARRLYNGVQLSKDGLRVLMLDRDKALENVARHLGMFKDKVEVTGKDGGPIEVKKLQDMTDEELLAIATGGSAGVTDPAPGQD